MTKETREAKEKVCSSCKTKKSHKQFGKSKIAKDGFRSQCKECESRQTKAYRHTKHGWLVQSYQRQTRSSKESEAKDGT